MTENKYNIMHVQINGQCREQVTIGKKDSKQMCEGFKTTYELSSGYGNWEVFYYMESSMNKNIK